MRQLPANSGGATSTTENSRSRSQQANESAGVTTLSNGSVKEPIVTRSKSRLRVGRRLSGRSPKKPDTPKRANDTYHEGTTPRRKPDRGASTTSSGQSSPSSSSPKNDGNLSERSSEKVYARVYKSYRGINGIKSRRGDTSMAENHSRTVGKRREEDSMEGPRTYENRRSLVRNRLRGNRSASNKNAVAHQNGTTLSPPTGTRSSRVRQLMLRRKKQLSRRKGSNELSSGSSSPQLSPKNGKVEDLSERKDRAGKRRSALWVLNCEAESFLFGETAADKHEVELPPLAPPSPPPKKRRKWRVTELAHLLEKSPILESKLRKSSSSESGSDMQREVSPPRSRLKPSAPRTPRRVRNTKRREKTPEMCSTSSKSVKGRNQEEVVVEEEEEQQVLSPQPQPLPELLSPIPFLYSPDSAADHEARTVQFQQMVANVNWRYSFEEPPTSESWYNAFSRSEDSIVPYSSFVNPLHEPVVLPYEMDKPIRRSRSKPVRNSRKSPRCHASTLAILSSERPTRSTRSSVTLDSSPTPTTVNTLQSESTLSALLISPTPNPHTSTSTTTPIITTITTTSTSSTVTTRVSPPPKCIPTTSRRRNPSSPKVNQSGDSKKELGAAQYLWDSIQFLSDPYVVTLLAGEDPDLVPETSDHTKNNNKGFVKNHRCNNNNNNYVVNNCPVKHMVKNLEASERKASLRSGDTGTGTNSNTVTSSRLASLPKCSSRNHSHGTNHVGGGPPISPSFASNEQRVAVNGVSRRFTSRSPPLSPPTKQTNCHAARLSPKNSKGTNAKQSKALKGSGLEGDNGIISYEKSSKKSPIVLVTDIRSATTKTKINSWDEESLFIGDGLPPLPSWPV
ncbi:hypothetical protein Ocin01_09803 [Orchesella cincta]|uniref:Uncharacterized protein n=1 Tax=Orchesella cincta TaxID=48709 RepID=A0A1D2MVP6_ORCCI|nr:hypothetical protein Ocin01_09803 [Orchesella cincta]